MGFKGYKATLYLNNGELKIKANVRYARISSAFIDKTIRKQLVMRDDKGYRVSEAWVDQNGNVITKRSKIYINERGERVPKDKIRYFLVQEDGTEVEVESFERTNELEIIDFVPADRINEFLIEGIYEIWAEKKSDIAELYQFAKFLRDRNLAGVTKISFGGFKEYYAIIYPLFRDGSFLLLMGLTRMKMTLSHWMPIVEKAEEERRTARKVKATLLDSFFGQKEEKREEKELEREIEEILAQ